ncbi:MAG TPA: hypothetical protein VG327_20860, partial [Mycobacterium sp.]|nr:hypothetical protein [Mycobacterium sp.]
VEQTDHVWRRLDKRSAYSGSTLRISRMNSRQHAVDAQVSSAFLDQNKESRYGIRSHRFSGVPSKDLAKAVIAVEKLLLAGVIGGRGP